MKRRLTIVCGLAGAGKSTYGKRLAAETGACLLDSDTVTEPVVMAGMELAGLDPKDRDSDAYRRAFRDPVYECLFATAAENLNSVDVILVGPFTTEIQSPSWPDELRERFGVEVEFIYLACEDELRRRRIEERGNPRDDWKLAHWEDHLALGGGPPAFPCTIIS